MKKMIILTALIAVINIHHTVCMENATKKNSCSWDIIDYLNWHNSPFPEHNEDNFMCKQVESVIQEGADVNKKEINQMSLFCDMTPLEVAIWKSKCPRCIALLKERGALETEMSHYYEAQMKVKRMNLK